VDSNSLLDLWTRGWKITGLTNHSYSQVTVILGSVNVGKTMIVNDITGKNLPSGSTIHTTGINIEQYQLCNKCEHRIIIDGQGTMIY
jgi:hypothetical protein